MIYNILAHLSKKSQIIRSPPLSSRSVTSAAATTVSSSHESSSWWRTRRRNSGRNNSWVQYWWPSPVSPPWRSGKRSRGPMSMLPETGPHVGVGWRTSSGGHGGVHWWSCSSGGDEHFLHLVLLRFIRPIRVLRSGEVTSLHHVGNGRRVWPVLVRVGPLVLQVAAQAQAGEVDQLVN